MRESVLLEMYGELLDMYHKAFKNVLDYHTIHGAAWRDIPIEQLMNDLAADAGELIADLDHSSEYQFELCLDIANRALMIADRLKKK